MKVHVYRDKSKKWRWQKRHDNGNVISDSGQGQVRKNYCVKTATNQHPGIEVVVEPIK